MGVCHSAIHVKEVGLEGALENGEEIHAYLRCEKEIQKGRERKRRERKRKERTTVCQPVPSVSKR